MFSKTRACGPETHGGLWQINSGPVIVCVRSDVMTILVLTTLLIFLTPGIGWRFYCVCVSGANDSPYHLDVSKNVFVFVTVFVTIVVFIFPPNHLDVSKCPKQPTNLTAITRLPW